MGKPACSAVLANLVSLPAAQSKVMFRVGVTALVLCVCVCRATIHDEIQRGSFSGVQKSLASADELNAPGPGGQSPLMHAVLAGMTDIVELLLENGADTTIPEKDGYTPMHGAGFQGRAEIAELLITKAKLDPSDRHADGYTPLHRACWGDTPGHTQMVEVLLEFGVSPAERTNDGKLPRELTQNKDTLAVLDKAMERAQLLTQMKEEIATLQEELDAQEEDDRHDRRFKKLLIKRERQLMAKIKHKNAVMEEFKQQKPPKREKLQRLKQKPKREL